MLLFQIYNMESSKQSLAQNVKLKCRVCTREIFRKNYKSHLQTSHPNADANDLSPLGQIKITSLFKGAGKSNPTDIRVEADALDIELTREVEEEEEGRKRRHESGESLESGFDEPVSDEKKRKEEKVEVDNRTSSSGITLSTLNDKLDKILVEVKGTRAGQTNDKSQSRPHEQEVPPSLAWIKHSRSLKEVLEAGFSYDEYSGAVTCIVCSEDSNTGGTFYYSASHGHEFDDDVYLPREFSSLKRNIIRHIETSKSHMDAVTDIRSKEKAKNALISKNRQAGINLGRLCMEKYLKGRPYTDYETDVLLLSKSGAVVGEVNHSRKFPAALRPSVTKVVHSKVSKFLKTPLKQTGHLPACGVSADKGTYKHRSRQFLSCVVIMPGGNNWLEVLTCGQPVVTEGSSGLQLAKNMKGGFDYIGLNPVQIESGVFDGVYFHCSIEEHLGRLYNFPPGKVLYSWDALHKTGLVDKHMNAQESFKWLQDMVSWCSQIFNTFNWGANYEQFRDATATWKLSLSNLVNFSDTRFANSKRKVFKNIHHQFAPIITCLEQQMKAGRENRSGLEAANTQVRTKADKATELHGKVLSLDFLLTLSGLADIYEQFGVIVQVTQMVHLLPHERLDMYTKAVKMLSTMALCQDHVKCAEHCDESVKVKCFWPLNHADKRSFSEKGKIRDLTVVNKHGVRAAGLQVTTRKETGDRLVRAGEDTVKKSDEKLLSVVRELAVGLGKEVYSDDLKAVIEATRPVLDLAGLASKLKNPEASYIKVAATEFPQFKQAVDKVPITSLQPVPVEELKLQYRLFLNRLAAMTSKLSMEDLKNTDSKDLIMKFFDPTGKEFENVEMIMQVSKYEILFLN